MATPPEIPRPRRQTVEEFARRFQDAHLTVLGDVMLDRYFWGDVDRISPEAPVPVVRVTRRSARLGGAANVAANLRALGAAVRLVGVTGDDREADELRELAAESGLQSDGLVVEPGRETTEKVRIIARSQQVVRADFETGDPVADATARRMLEVATAAAGDSDALVISDYGKGVLRQETLAGLISTWREAGKPVLVDPHVPHFRWYRGATVITPNAREALQAAGVTFDTGSTASGAAFAAIRELELDALLVTRGEHGMSLFHGRDSEVHIPTVAKEVYDVTGAGDTVISVLALALALGADLELGVVLANAAAGEVVKEVGTSVLPIDEFLNAFV